MSNKDIAIKSAIEACLRHNSVGQALKAHFEELAVIMILFRVLSFLPW
jgi:hypothetical protein